MRITDLSQLPIGTQKRTPPPRRQIRLAVIDSHPIQYHYQYYKLLTSVPGIDVTVFYCWDTREGVQDPSYGKIKWDVPVREGYRHCFVPNWAWRPGVSFFGQINPGLVRRIIGGNFDAVWIWGYSTASSWIGALAARMKGTNILFRGEATLTKLRSLPLRLAKEVVVRGFLRMVSGVTYSCTANREYYRYYGVPEERLIFVPCAVDNDFFFKQARQLDRRTCRERIGVPESVRVILFVGRFVEVKRPLDIICAWERQGMSHAVHLVMVGDGRLRTDLEAYCAKRLLQNIHFTGFKNQSELGIYYGASDLFVLASSVDPSPKSLNEAMCFGLPVVVSDRVGTAQDLVQEGVNGLIVPVADVQALAEAMRRILFDAGNRRRMGENSRKIIQEWTFQRGAENIRKWLEQTVRR